MRTNRGMKKEENKILGIFKCQEGERDQTLIFEVAGGKVAAVKTPPTVSIFFCVALFLYIYLCVCVSALR